MNQKVQYGQTGFGDEFTQNWPSVNPEAVERETGDTGVPWTDVDGQVFDPEQHVWDRENDKPKYTQKGRFKKRPRRKSKAQAGTGDNGLNTEGVTDTQESVAQMGSREAAQITVQLMGSVGAYIAPDMPAFDQDEYGQSEYYSGIEAWKACYDAYGVTYVPPWLAPTLWTFGYFSRRMTQSNQGRSKIKAAWHWVKSKIPRRKKRQQPDAEEQE
jgi:hypothetical protein